MSHGVVIHAYNNRQIDYGLISLCNALAIKSNLDVPVCLITDESTLNYLSSNHESRLIEKAFDHVIFHPVDGVPQTKTFNDTLSTSFVMPWRNTSRSDSYDLTPFDETLVIDSDYFICDRSLRNVWGSYHDIMINRRVVLLDHEVPSDVWLETTGIRMCWATCIYFKKSEQAAMLFDLVKHIRFYYQYYSMVYGFSTNLYRNDYAFSIAVHMMNGFVPDDIPTLPVDFLLSSYDRDELIDVPAKDEFVFLVKSKDSFTLSRTKNMNVHIMNKFSIVRQSKKMLALYG